MGILKPKILLMLFAPSVLAIVVLGFCFLKTYGETSEDKDISDYGQVIAFYAEHLDKVWLQTAVEKRAL